MFYFTKFPSYRYVSFNHIPIMKKLFTILFLFAALMVKAQYSTPGTGVTWSLDDLVQNSAGTVTLNGDHYEITATLTILPADAIEILGDVTVLFHDLAGIESEGTLIVNAPNQSVFTAIDSTSENKWRGLKLLAGHITQFRNTTFSFGGGIRCQSGTISVDGCTLYKNINKSGSGGSYASSGALDISGDALVVNSSFLYNQRGAISSSSNIACRANIRNNYIFGNTVENSNRPQINMGPSGPGDTTFIVGNTVIGNGSTNAGGIAFSSLTGLRGNVVIDSNLIDLNRYGITLTGSPIHGAIRYNTVTNNNIQNNPDLGGSGLNFTASGASSEQIATVTGNVISGNLWGITIIGYAHVNMGDSTSATFNPGGNQFSDNGNGGILYDLYNNGPINQPAMYNCWGVPVQDAASIESVIFHKVDDPTLGRVDFMPSCAFQTLFTVQNEAGTLLQGVEIAIAEEDASLFTDANGEAMAMLSPGFHSFTASRDGYSNYNGSVAVMPGFNTLQIIMTQGSHTVTFIVDSNVGLMQGAEILINGETLITNDEGIAIIQLPDGEYPYTATAIMCSTIEGIVIVNGADVEVILFLETGIHNPLAAALKVYPNPVADRLYLEGAKIDAAEVYSVTGKLLLRFEQVNGFIDIRDLEPGMYLIRVKSQDLETSLRVVKK